MRRVEEVFEVTECAVHKHARVTKRSFTTYKKLMHELDERVSLNELGYNKNDE